MAEDKRPDVPTIFKDVSPPPVLLAQGAEAILYKSFFLDPTHPCAIKHRPPKPWRHPNLDSRLTRHRILAEARILVRCRKGGVSVPRVLALDWEGRKDANGRSEGGWMMVEWIDGMTVRAALKQWTNTNEAPKPHGDGPGRDRPVLHLMGKMARAIAKLHELGVVHGDLTTSNLMLRPSTTAKGPSESIGENLEGEVFLIDFGLATASAQDEDRAVDLYVLERAYGSTHPTIENYFQRFLEAYGESYKGARHTLKRLEDVRQRGRKKSMIG